MLGIQLHNGEWSSKNVESVRESMLRKNYKAEKQNANSDCAGAIGILQRK